LEELKPSANSAEGQEDTYKAGRLLGMAIRVASGKSNALSGRFYADITAPIIHQILAHPAVASPNLPVTPGSLATPLHIAAEIGRVDAGMPIIVREVAC
jgi:hypothetical protein